MNPHLGSWVITPGNPDHPYPANQDGPVVGQLIAADAIAAVIAFPCPGFDFAVPVVIGWEDVHTIHASQDAADHLAEVIALELRDDTGAVDATQSVVDPTTKDTV